MSAELINLAVVRDQRRVEARARATANKPEWGDDIHAVCTYARLLQAEHGAEAARIDFDLLRDHGDCAWWDAPEDIKERVDENNRRWQVYADLLSHLASIPAQTRAEASAKRSAIGKMWLCASPTGSKWIDEMRDGCLADDHLFPPSLRLARPNRRKG